MKKCTIVIPKRNSYCRHKSSARGPWFKVSSVRVWSLNPRSQFNHIIAQAARSIIKPHSKAEIIIIIIIK